jgi:queuosine precursor transporter
MVKKFVMFNFGDQAEEKYVKRREIVFMLLTGFFLGTLAILNILGISRQINLSFNIFGASIPFIVFVGVLPYPITFLCTDFISELFGKKRANMVVIIGFVLNMWVIAIMWLGSALPPRPELDPATGLPFIEDPDYVFFKIQQLTRSAVASSMIAYLAAQFVDVYIFHFFKKLTKGKHLWLRNNGSTLTSQLVDSVAVVTITYMFAPDAISILPGQTVFQGLLVLAASNYIFKMVSALIDTIPFYWGVKFFSKYLNIDPNRDFKMPGK